MGYLQKQAIFLFNTDLVKSNLLGRQQYQNHFYLLILENQLKLQFNSIANIFITITINCMDTVVKERVSQLQNQCENLLKQGKYAECIDFMEEIVSIKKTVYGMDHIEFEKSSQKLCEYLNLAAMFNLQKQNFDVSIDYLRKAQLVCQNSLQYKSTTYNNLACYYRRIGKLRTALSYLIQALELQLKLEHPLTLADTHLNLCAVLSQLDKHEDALQHSMLSIILLQDELLQVSLSKLKSQGCKQINDQRLAVLTIAYHNMGVQFQHLKRFDQALKIYNKALQISTDYLKDNQQLIANMTKVVKSANEQIQQQKRILKISKKNKVSRQVSQTKRDIYRDIAKQAQRYRNLPKLKIRDDYPVIQYNPTLTTQLNRTIGFKNIGRSKDKHFSTKARSRVYKSTSVSKQLYQAKRDILNQQQECLITNQLNSSNQEDFSYH